MKPVYRIPRYTMLIDEPTYNLISELADELEVSKVGVVRVATSLFLYVLKKHEELINEEFSEYIKEKVPENYFEVFTLVKKLKEKNQS